MTRLHTLAQKNDIKFCISILNILIATLGLTFGAYGQYDVDKLHFDHLTIEEGLSHNSVFALLQDSDGYIWIGTQSGLNRYDAFDVKIYRDNLQKDAIDAFVGNTVTALFEDSQGKLWVGTEKNGINWRVSGAQKFENQGTHDVFSTLLETRISSIYEDEHQIVWVASIGAGLFSYNINTQETKQYTSENSGLSTNLVFDVVSDTKGNIWIATDGVGLHVLDSKNQITLRYENEGGRLNGYRKTLLIDQDKLWVGTDESGLYQLDLKTETLERFHAGTKKFALSSNSVRALAKLRDHHLFVGTDGGGINVLDLKENTIRVYKNDFRDPRSPNSDAIISVIQDNEKNLWIGTFNGGVNIVNDTEVYFEHLNKSNSNLKNQSFLSIMQSNKGDIFLGTDGGGVYKLDAKDLKNIKTHFEYNSKENSISGNVVKTMMEDREGKFWIGTFKNGLTIYDPKSELFTPIKNESVEGMDGFNSIWSIVERKNGEIWIGSLGRGIYITDINHREIRQMNHDPDDPNSLSNSTTIVLFEDHTATMWVGTEEDGLDRWNDMTQRFEHFKHDPNAATSISSNEVRSIFEDSKNQLWVGTEGGGLNKWSESMGFSRILQRDGLISNDVMGIEEDNNGLLWVSSYRGISTINPETSEIINFDFHSSGSNNQFNQMSILKDDQGRLYFGGINGLQTIYPSSLQNIRQHHTHPIFTSLKVLNKEVDLEAEEGVLTKTIEKAQDIYLDYQDKSFTISFSAFDFFNQFDRSYYYFLDGFDLGWRETANGNNSVTYTNLDPGNYQFKVKYEDRQNLINIHIRPPFYQTWWFVLMAACLVLGLLYFISRYFNAKKEANFQRKLLIKEREILELKNKNLEKNVGISNAKLLSSTAQMARKNEFLNDIKSDLQHQIKIEDLTAARSIIGKIERELQSEDYWAAFNLHFDNVDKNFIKSIVVKHPNLTQNDIRLSAMIRINLSTKEIASLMNISVRGAEKSRYRLKKRLALDQDQSLIQYIREFQPN